MLLADNIVEAIQEFIELITSKLDFFWLSMISLGLFCLIAIITFLRIRFGAIEVKTNKAMNKVGNYLASTPFITEENIVEFNNLMKKIPDSMRLQWQNYMLNRSEKPSKYLNQENIVENPFKTSKFKTAIMLFNLFVGLVAGMSFLVNLSLLVSEQSVGYVLFQSIIIPLGLLVLAILFNMIFVGWKNSVTTNCYMNASQLAKMIDRATTTMPPYVDYEILFTRKEIARGIPALQEYLQQRAQFEQEEIEKAKQSEVEHAEYDFSSLGINGSLVMERALKESEFFLGNKRRYLQEIEQIESEKDMLTRNHDDKNKTSQRKLRDIKETLDRLKEKLDSTTNKIVANDIRRQQGEEVKKQQAVEKEMEEDTAKFQRDYQKLDDEVTNRRAEIEKAKKYVENTLNGEFKEYADKMYAEIKRNLEERYYASLNEYEYERNDIQQKIEEKDKYNAEREALFQEKINMLDQYAQALQERDTQIRVLNEQLNEARNTVHKRDANIKRDLDDKINELSIRDKELYSKMQVIEQQEKQLDEYRTKVEQLEGEIAREQSKKPEVQVKEVVKEVYRYFDDTGTEFFIDENGEAYYLDEKGNRQYYTDDEGDEGDDGALQENIEPAKPEPAKPVPAKEQPVKATPVQKEEPKPTPKPQKEDNLDEINAQIAAENKKLENQGKQLRENIEVANEISQEDDSPIKFEDLFGDVDINQFNQQINTAITDMETKTPAHRSRSKMTTKAQNRKK